MKKLGNIILALIISFGIFILFSSLAMVSFFNYGFLDNFFEPVYSFAYLLAMLEIHPVIIVNVYLVIIWSVLFGITLGIISIFRDEKKLMTDQKR